MKKTIQNGLLITIEGIDGSGKSTLAKNLTALLQDKNYAVFLTKEPGGSSLGKKLRSLLQTQPFPITSLSEYLLFAADRAQHMQEVVLPHLQQNTIVISDRMADSSIVYQGYGRGLDVQQIITINKWTMQQREPDITLYVQIPVAEAQKRLKQRNTIPTAFEKENEEFIQRVADGFDKIFSQPTHTTAHVYILDGTQTPEKLTQQAYTTIEQWLTR